MFLSLKIGVSAATLATLFGTMAGMALARFGGFRGRTSECYGCEAFVRGIFDEKGRLMVVVNANTDLGDAWEWFEQPQYPLEYSSYAVQMGVNFVIYAMSH